MLYFNVSIIERIGMITNYLCPVHSLDVLQQTLLVIDDQHVTQVAAHSVGLLLDGGAFPLGVHLGCLQCHCLP